MRKNARRSSDWPATVPAGRFPFFFSGKGAGFKFVRQET